MSVHLFPLYLLNRLTFELEFCMCVCVCHDHSSPLIKSQGQKSMYNACGRGNAVMRSVWHRSSIEDSFSSLFERSPLDTDSGRGCGKAARCSTVPGPWTCTLAQRTCSRRWSADGRPSAPCWSCSRPSSRHWPSETPARRPPPLRDRTAPTRHPHVTVR